MKQVLTFFVALIAVAFMASFAMAAGTYEHQNQSSAASGKWQNFSGKINKSGEFVSSNGETYRLSGNKAKELRQHEGQRVEVRGTVMEQNGHKTLNVESFNTEGTRNMQREYRPNQESQPGMAPRTNPQTGSQNYK